MTVPLTLTVPLTGVLLVSCVKAQANSSSASLAKICGYGEDVDQFKASLGEAYAALGLTPDEINA